jgi:hypothetical protein
MWVFERVCDDRDKRPPRATAGRHAALERSNLPTVVEAAFHLARFDPEEEFEFALDALTCTALTCTALTCTALTCTALTCTALSGPEDSGGGSPATPSRPTP